MKKLLLAAAIVVGASATVTPLLTQQIEASAKTYDMSPAFAKALKKGTMPRLNGKVGMKYKTLKQKEPKGHAFISDRFNFYELNDQSQSRDLYGFKDYEKIAPSHKVTIIMRTYDYLISSSSVEKHFGKPYKAIDMDNKKVNSYVYKAGKYYVLVLPDKKLNSTDIYVGTKFAILNSMLYKKIYR